MSTTKECEIRVRAPKCEVEIPTKRWAQHAIRRQWLDIKRMNSKKLTQK